MKGMADKPFLVVFIASIVIWLACLIYTLKHSNFNRLKGYDKYGNICGQKNIRHDGFEFSGQDVTLKPYLLEGECVVRAIPSWGAAIFFHHKKVSQKLAELSLIPVALCLISAILFRHATAITVWSTLILFWIMCPITWLLLIISELYVESIIISVVGTLILCLIIFYAKKIKMATVLLRKATKAIFDVNAFYITIPTLLVLVTMFVSHIIITLHIVTAGKLTKTIEGYLEYTPDGWMRATLILNPMMAVWMAQFIYDVQQTTVAGAVAEWHFARNGDVSSKALSTSFRITCKHHLGTIALSSAGNTIVAIPRIVLKCLSQLTVMHEMVDYWLRSIDGYFTKNLYIVSVIHGWPCRRSGEYAVKLLKLSMGNTINLESLGNSVIVASHIITVVVSTVATSVVLARLAEIYYVTVFGALIEFGIAYICIQTILGAFEVACSTIFLCITEESLYHLQDGYPYTISMKEFSAGSDTLFIRKVQNENLQLHDRNAYP